MRTRIPGIQLPIVLAIAVAGLSLTTARAQQTKRPMTVDDALDLVFILVPKRHTETWVHALGPTNPPVNEQDDYKPKTIDEIKAAARRLADLKTTPSAPPSLVHGYEELRRLKTG